jgi:hypothetical protein
MSLSSSFEEGFKAEMVNNVLVIKPIIERDKGNVTIHVPSFEQMGNALQKYKEDNFYSK